MLRLDRDGSVQRVVLDRPEVRNAFNDELIQRLSEVFSSVPSEVRVIVLSGEGKAFCAGGDLEWMRRAASKSEQENFEDALRLARLFQLIQSAHALVIAQVHGAAFGGGCGLVAAADLALAEEATRFSFSEVKIGLIPATIAPLVIPKIGAGHARALFMTGEVFAGRRAKEIGLVHEVAPDAALPELVDRTIANVLHCGPKAVISARNLVLEAGMSVEESARRLASTRAGAEGREGVAAFLEKRKPSFAEDR